MLLQKIFSFICDLNHEMCADVVLYCTCQEMFLQTQTHQQTVCLKSGLSRNKFPSHLFALAGMLMMPACTHYCVLIAVLIRVKKIHLNIKNMVIAKYVNNMNQYYI